MPKNIPEDKPQYTFIKRRDPENRFDTTDVIFRVDTVSKNELLDAMGQFLKACGFYVQGELVDYVENVKEASE